MKKITTSTGFTCDIDENLKNDFRLARAVAKAESADGDEFDKIAGVDEIAIVLLGTIGRKRLERHIMKQHKIVDSQAYITEISEILTKMGDEDADIKN